MSELEALKRRLDQERNARKAAEALLELKSRQLYDINQALRKQQQEQQIIFNSVPALIWYKDNANRILRLNRAAAEAMGDTPDRIEGRRIEELMPVELAAGYLMDDLEVINSGTPKRGILEPIRKPSGELVWIVADKFPYRDESGKAIGVIVFATDVTERRRAEEAAQSSENKFRSLIENIKDIITILDAKGTILYESPSMTRVLGYLPAELVGRNVFERIHADDIERLKASFARNIMHAGLGPVPQTFRYRHKNDEWRILEAIGNNLMHDPAVRGIVVISRDVTDSYRAGIALRDSEAQYRNLYENAPIGIYRTTPEGRIVMANPALVRMLGYSTLDELCTRNLEKEGFDTGSPRSRFRSVMDKDGEIKQMESAWHTHKGSKIFVRENARAVRDSAGAVVYYEGTVEDVSERKRAEEKIQHQLLRLNALHEIDLAITSSSDLSVTLNVLLEKILSHLHVAAADIMLLNAHSLYLELAASRGFRLAAVFPPRRLGQGHAGRAALERRSIGADNLAGDTGQFAAVSIEDDLGAYFAVPLVAKGEVKGVLEVYLRAGQQPDDDWVGFLNTLAGQAAVAIDNATLFESIQRSNTELALAYDSTLEGWSRALDLRDKETEGHTQRVTNMTMRLASSMGLSAATLLNVRRGALLHDIGKMGIPDSILLKPGKLTDKEWVIMRKHPEYAYELLSPIEFLRTALDIPYCHHEKWDGTGYPRGLKGTAIPLAARVFAIVDIWDALRNDRPYRPAWPDEKVRDHIAGLKGTHLDPSVNESFVKMIW